ncbi:unnamed protein product [Polarella glacialis]|uniref:Uncharacterized protein n=1 Tax=Polarella glacialis TaxID=89957 RepID=A0A813LP76_POLGL|nr:unnamed protein product [Polarella glacialis]
MLAIFERPVAASGDLSRLQLLGRSNGCRQWASRSCRRSRCGALNLAASPYGGGGGASSSRSSGFSAERLLLRLPAGSLRADPGPLTEAVARPVHSLPWRPVLPDTFSRILACPGGQFFGPSAERARCQELPVCCILPCLPEPPVWASGACSLPDRSCLSWLSVPTPQLQLQLPGELRERDPVCNVSAWHAEIPGASDTFPQVNQQTFLHPRSVPMAARVVTCCRRVFPMPCHSSLSIAPTRSCFCASAAPLSRQQQVSSAWSRLSTLTGDSELPIPDIDNFNMSGTGSGHSGDFDLTPRIRYFRAHAGRKKNQLLDDCCSARLLVLWL